MHMHCRAVGMVFLPVIVPRVVVRMNASLVRAHLLNDRTGR